MKGRAVSVFGLAGMLLFPVVAAAQEKGDTGFVASAPASIGMIWHATDRLALRPEVSFGFTATDGRDIGPDIDSRSVSLGVAALFYVKQWDDARAYVSPRYAYSYSSSSIEGISLDSTSTGQAVSGTFGAQYGFSSRFGVFGEAGVQFASQVSSTDGVIGDVERTTWTFGSRAAVGVILYF